MIQEKQKLRESKGNSLIDNPRSFVVFDIETKCFIYICFWMLLY